MRRLLVDTDTAADDPVALVMALRHLGVRVEAITVVAGNVPVDQGVQNALYTLELLGEHVPVLRGAESPLLAPLKTSQFIHGEDGMGDRGLPLHGREPHPGHAVDALLEVAKRYPGQVELVTLGPLTNVAMALHKDPSFAAKVKGCVMMCGAADHLGNITPVAEFNVWVDPEAAEVVFSSGMPIKMVAWTSPASTPSSRPRRRPSCEVWARPWRSSASTSRGSSTTNGTGGSSCRTR
jgi:purine nucleosidase